MPILNWILGEWTCLFLSERYVPIAKGFILSLLIFCMIVTTTGCSTITTNLMKPDVAKLAEKYLTLTGTLAAPPVLMNSNHRLVLFFSEQSKPELDNSVLMRDGNGDITTDTDGVVVVAPKPEKEVAKEVLTCVAENEQNKQVLINVRTYLNDPKAAGKVIYIYGRKIDGPWNEYTSGMNFYIEAVGLYVPASAQYVVITTGFGDGMFDQVSWISFMKQVGMTAIKSAL